MEVAAAQDRLARARAASAKHRAHAALLSGLDAVHRERVAMATHAAHLDAVAMSTATVHAQKLEQVAKERARRMAEDRAAAEQRALHLFHITAQAKNK